jgi:DNA-binding GntR family transcriptional regulator
VPNSLAPKSTGNLVDSVYGKLKADLFDFHLLPGDRFTEVEVANRTGASRTPVRQALFRLQQEGFLDVTLRHGWEVRQLDFAKLDALYQLRVLLEQAAIRRLRERNAKELQTILAPLEAIWLVQPGDRCNHGMTVAAWDEEFHASLVASSRNSEFTRVHLEVTEKIRIMRRLDFTKSSRVTATYEEHGSMLKALAQRDFDSALDQLTAHIEASRAQARRITMLRLQTARKSIQS